MLIKQGSWALIEYYHKLWVYGCNYYWHRNVAVVDTAIVKKIMEQEGVFEFLAGLNPELD